MSSKYVWFTNVLGAFAFRFDFSWLWKNGPDIKLRNATAGAHRCDRASNQQRGRQYWRNAVALMVDVQKAAYGLKPHGLQQDANVAGSLTDEQQRLQKILSDVLPKLQRLEEVASKEE